MPGIIGPDVTSARTRARKLSFLAVALAPTICVMGCATATAPVASHGMDQIPAYDASYYGDVGIERGFLSPPGL
jgi:hypothetical protein